MLKSKILAIGTASVLAVSLLSGGTYAWFSALASASMGGINGNDGSGSVNGIVAGHVDLALEFASYTEYVDANGNVQKADVSKSPYIIYPGNIVDKDGNPVDSGMSVLKYRVFNTSGTEVIARIDHYGLEVQDNKITDAKVNLRRLLGATTPEINTESDMTWFYFAENPSGDRIRYVDINKLIENDFLNPSKIYKVDAKGNTGDMNRVDFYGKTHQISLKEAEGIELISDGSIVSKTFSGLKESIDDFKNGTTVADRDAVAVSMETINDYTYMRMPANSYVEFRLQLKLAGSGAEGDKTAFMGDNSYQYAVYSLAMEKLSNNAEPSGTDIAAYATQVKKAALESFYGKAVADKMPAAWLVD